MDEEIKILKQKIEALETAINKLNELKLSQEETIKFQTRLIASLKAAETKLKTYLLPIGTFHGTTID